MPLRIAASSLRARALIGLAAGLLTLAGLLLFITLDEGQLVAAQNRVAQARQLQDDEAELARGMADQRTGIESFGASGRLELLAPYLLGSAILANSHEILTRDASGTPLQDAAAIALARADRWQAWAERFRDLVDAGGRDAKSVPSGEGALLFSSYQASDDQLKAEAAHHRAVAELGLRQADVRHRLGLAAGIAVTAIALLLVALALLRSTLLPVARLTRAAEELAAGHPVSLPYGDRRDEVGRLAGSLRSWQQTAAEDKSVFDHAPIGICRIAPNGKLINANPALLQILHLERDLLPLLWFPAFTVNPDPDAWKLIREAQQVTEREYAAGEGIKWCRVTVAPVPGERAEDAYWVGMLEDVTVARTQAEQLRHQAGHDSLTGLPNRRLFLDRLRQVLLGAGRSGASTALLLVDLDGFKAVNDELGHQAGDAALREVGARFTATLRASDTVARLGGDEFAILLQGQSTAGAVTTARKLLQSLGPEIELPQSRRRLGASIGIACLTGPADPDAAMAAADGAMYAAKRGGGGYRVAGLEPAATG